MVLIDKIWDDFMGGPTPEKGLGKLRKPITVRTAPGGDAGEGSRMPGTPPTPGTPVNMSPTARKDNVWRSVFNPGSNSATKRIGAEVFDKPSHPNSPTVYDWLYSGETRSKHQ